LKILGRAYDLEYDSDDPFVISGLDVAYSDDLARDLLPVIFDPRGHGSSPFPPVFVAYRLVVDPEVQRLCVLYEVYWRRQDCTWRHLNKDHDHDYEQIQIHVDLRSGEVERVVVSSVGPFEHGGHGVEVYGRYEKADYRDVQYVTSPMDFFPWGGLDGERHSTQIREIPVGRLMSMGPRPCVLVVNCYHVFTGLKGKFREDMREELKPPLRRLDRALLETWYYRHVRNRFGHDVSDPFEEPYIRYSPPPEDWRSRIVYSILWVIYSLERRLFRR
jgi:hypothetical protein